MVSDSRSQRQQLGIQRWKEAKCSATFSWATGMGKTFTALHIVKLCQEKNPNLVTHIVAPTIFLQAQFYTALKKAKLPNVEVFVINTYIAEPRTCDLLVADEVHIYLGENAEQFPKIFTSLCKHSWVIALSATLTDEEQTKLTALGIPVCDTITLQEAQANGWVAKCRTYNLGVQLTPQEQAEYTRHNDIFQSTFARFSHDFALAMACVGSKDAREKYAARMGWTELMGKDDRWSPQTLGSAANQWLRATHARQEVVNNCAAKYDAAAYLCRTLPVKTICFSESTAFASNLAAMMPDICRAYHSQLQSEKREYTTVKTFKTKPDVVTQKIRSVGPATLRQEALQAFADSESPIRVLSTAKALDQGADFAGLQLGVESSGNSSIRQKVQRTGRVVRADSIEDKLAVYVHVYAAGTYEQNKLRRKQRGITGIIETSDIRTITL